MKITVFTPTFNRGYILKKCYESLKSQTYNDFEWLIYDDGSTDNTKEVIEEFIKEGIIEIRYYYGKNKGKHVAINHGTDLAQGELFFIVDSDDCLPNDALKIINEVWNSIDDLDKENYAGIGGRRFFINKENKKFNFMERYHDTDAITFNLIEKNLQDKAEVYRTELLKSYKFPVISGEKFMTEAVVWYRIANDGFKIRWFNQDIYTCEYLEGGLSDTSYLQRINSIQGTCLTYKLLSSYELPKSYRIRYRINYFRYGLTRFKLKSLINNLNDKEYRLISLLGGLILFLFDKIILKFKNKESL